jgi:hypothetical protein
VPLLIAVCATVDCPAQPSALEKRCAKRPRSIWPGGCGTPLESAG